MKISREFRIHFGKRNVKVNSNICFEPETPIENILKKFKKEYPQFTNIFITYEFDYKNCCYEGDLPNVKFIMGGERIENDKEFEQRIKWEWETHERVCNIIGKCSHGMMI